MKKTLAYQRILKCEYIKISTLKKRMDFLKAKLRYILSIRSEWAFRVSLSHLLPSAAFPYIVLSSS